jgi:hypothetical protein
MKMKSLKTLFSQYSIAYQTFSFILGQKIQ